MKKNVALYSARGQALMLLFAALDQLSGSASKREVLSKIETNGWFLTTSEDREPYPSQEYTTKEPRWMTLIAWARKDAVEAGLISKDERDSWALTRAGRDQWTLWIASFQSGAWRVSDGYLWSADFKKYLNPNFQPSAQDMTRPPQVYRDHRNKAFAEELKRFLA